MGSNLWLVTMMTTVSCTSRSSRMQTISQRDKNKKEKGKKTNDSKEEMKENQPKKTIVKIEEVNVVTHDSDNGNDALFIFSYF